MARKAQGKIDAKLKKAIDSILHDVMTPDAINPNTGKKYAMRDKFAAIDRGLKFAAIQAKLNDSDYGSGFKDEED